ncbi:FixH family protein [Alsobacter metallidurans]|nr:FixH family protein [Alsobacter metallidurans]
MTIKGPVATAALLALTVGAPARADVKDYEFQLVTTEARQGEAVVAVRLIDRRSGKPVPDAVIFTKRLDMEPDGMAAMTSAIDQVASGEPGVYRFQTKLTMAGRWRISLGAKVQGEVGTVEGRLVLKAGE